MSDKSTFKSTYFRTSLKDRKSELEEIQRYYDTGNSIVKCMEKYNYGYGTLLSCIITRPRGKTTVGLSLEDRMARKSKIRNSPNETRTIKKRKLVEYKGGRCEGCGYNLSINNLMFHHKDPLIKDFNISSSNASLEDLKIECDKCSLLCSNCHSEVHEKWDVKLDSSHASFYRRLIKEKVLESMGGRCVICRYNKCSRAMVLHHLDPSVKESGIAKHISNNSDWSEIVPELRKCVLMCANCHGELHNGLFELVGFNIPCFNEKYCNYRYNKNLRIFEEDIINNCPVCGNVKKSYYRTCSFNCSIKSKKTSDWDGFDLYKMSVSDNISHEEIGRIIGRSGSAVKIRLEKLGIYIRRKK